MTIKLTAAQVDILRGAADATTDDPCSLTFADPTDVEELEAAGLLDTDVELIHGRDGNDYEALVGRITTDGETALADAIEEES